MRALLVGFFSTVGDLEVLAVVEAWLAEEDVAYDVAPYGRVVRAAGDGWLDPLTVDPRAYTHLVVVCGPFWREFFVEKGLDLDRFAHCVRIGVNLSMIQGLAEYNPLDAVVGRDSDAWTEPDLSFLAPVDRPQVVGLCLAPAQPEYGSLQLHEAAGEMLRRAASRLGLAVVDLDTRWPVSRNDGSLDSPGAFEAVCSRLDAVLTTRLHGMVISLKCGVPPLVLDPVAGGGKVARQGERLGWSEVHRADQVSEDELVVALGRCLGADARSRAVDCADRARTLASDLRQPFVAALSTTPSGRRAGTAPVETSRAKGSGALRRRWTRGG